MVLDLKRRMLHLRDELEKFRYHQTVANKNLCTEGYQRHALRGTDWQLGTAFP